MNKKYLIIGGIVAVIIVIIVLVFVLKKDDNHLDELMTYPGNVVCTLEGYDTYDGEDVPFTTRAYLTVEDDYVISAVYQTVTDTQNEQLVSAILKLYNDIDGIAVFTDKYENFSVLTIKHEYRDIDPKQVEEKLGDLLDKDSFFKKYNKYPINYGEYKASELKGYECHEN